LKISREIKTAILVIAAIALFIFGFNFLKGKDIFSSTATFHANFDYNALTTASPVTVKGNKIGKIESIKYDFNTGKTRVDFTVDQNFKFSKNSIVRLYEMGLMGGNALAIIPAKDGAIAVNGDELKSEVEKGLVDNLSKNFSGLSTNLDGTLKSADSLMINLNSLVTDKSDKGLKAAIAELSATMKSFKGLSYSLNSFINKDQSKLNKTLTNLNRTLDNFEKISGDLAKADLNKTVANLDETLVGLSDILKKLDNKDGTVGKLLNDDKLYNNLEGATKELEELLQDIKLHPKRYFRILSKKEIPYKKEQ